MHRGKRVFGLLMGGTLLITLAACQDESGAPSGPGAERLSPAAKGQGGGEPDMMAAMLRANDALRTQGLGIAAEAIEYFTIGEARPSDRIHAQPFRWVPNDPRRLAQGIDITYIVDQSEGKTFSGLTNAQTEPEIDAAMQTWDAEAALDRVAIFKRADPNRDITIFDFFFCDGRQGNPFAADIVSAGWWDPECFGVSTLAFSVTFIFVDDAGNPTDINGDGYLDTALNEVYFNDKWGNPRFDTGGLNPWTVGQQNLPAIDVRTVSFHELGHSLELGHFGPPPDAVMNPVYAGPRIEALSPDESGLQAVWQSWPNP
ncbi:MAG TPA: matrixin family metalloprotease [Gemmatimonadota bacterium]|nr:matrixin family metalloprotease [Gemmatimonadota bacterium]